MWKESKRKKRIELKTKLYEFNFYKLSIFRNYKNIKYFFHTLKIKTKNPKHIVQF